MSLLLSKLHNKIFGSRCEVKPGIKYFHASDFKNLRTIDFSFKNRNNFTIRGYYYYYSPIDYNSLVVFCHGMGGGHEAYMKEIEFLAKSGFTVLSIDYQGTILSEGDKLGGFLQGLSDIDELLTVIEKENQYKNIYLVGHSWGAFVAMNAIKFHPTVKKVVALSGFLSLKQMFQDLIPSPFKFVYKGLKKKEEKYNPKFKDISSLDSLNGFNGKALIMHSEDDPVVNVHTTFEVMKNNCTNKNIQFDMCTGKFHNITYKLDIIVALNNYLEKLKTLKTDEERIALRDETDFNTICDLDFGVMAKIVNFLRD